MATLPVLQSYTSPWVRALAWSCFSPSLVRATKDITPPALPLTDQRLQWLAALNRDDRPLRKHLDAHCNSPRLGLVFESLWHFFLREDPDTELLAHNLPVRHQGRTLGEFDIIYRDRPKNAVRHLELAVKFFLGKHCGELPLHDWLGPNSADRLDRKLSRLQSHQLKLADTSAGRKALREIGVDHCTPQLRVAGILFYPDGKPAWNPQINAEHPTGSWYYVSHFRQQLANAAIDIASWRHLEKPQWLRADYDGALPLETHHLQRAEQRPIMIINSALQRAFIVPDSWPAN